MGQYGTKRVIVHYFNTLFMEDCLQSSVTAWCENFEQNWQFSCSVSIKNGNQQMTADNGETIFLITFFSNVWELFLAPTPVKTGSSCVSIKTVQVGADNGETILVETLT